MEEVKYSYAKDKNNNFIHVLDATKDEDYYLLSEFGEEVIMTPVQGEERQWHFRSKVKGQAIGMTAEHINLQAFLCNSLEFYCSDLDLKITAKSSIPEYRLSNGRIVDVAYFDDYNDFLCGIEVVHTNDISEEKFKNLYESDYLIFKVYTNAPKRFIFIGNSKADRESYKKAQNICGKEIEKYRIKWRDEMGKSNELLSKKVREFVSRYRLLG